MLNVIIKDINNRQLQVCLACYRRVDGSYSCSRCGWPLCSESCEQMATSEHNRIECRLLMERKILPPSEEELLMDDVRIYDCFTPLRMVLDMQKMAEKRTSLNSLESHERFRRQRGIWHADEKNVVNAIMFDWKMANLVNAEELQCACGILEVNAFEGSLDSVTGMIFKNLNSSNTFKNEKCAEKSLTTMGQVSVLVPSILALVS